MATCTLQDVFQDVRGFLNDTGPNGSIPGGETFTNAALPVYFGEPYRSMFGKLYGASKRVQRVIYVVLPASTSILIPRTFAITDMSEPEMVEERPAPNAIPILSTANSTPILVTTLNPHGLGPNGSIAQGTISQVEGTSAPWGMWFAFIASPTTFFLRGSATDGGDGAGGFFYPISQQPFTEVQPIDLSAAGLDGQPTQTLGDYLWMNEAFMFRGASSDVQLRITYYASGDPPTNPNYVIQIDNCRDFLAKATAANAAASRGWTQRSMELRNEAYGDPTHPETVSLLDLFWNGQVLANQRGPIRRSLPFRDKRSRFGNWMLG